MKSSFKTVILFLAATAVSSVAGAQNESKMEKNNMKRVADTVKSGYQKIEDGVVKLYRSSGRRGGRLHPHQRCLCKEIPHAGR